MAKLEGLGQSSVLDDKTIEKILSFSEQPLRLFLQLLRFTGERPTAVLNLKRESCYDPYKNPTEVIIFPGKTRKQSAGQKADNRSVRVVPALSLELYQFGYPDNLLMFPSPTNPNQAASYFWIRSQFEKLLIKAKLQGKSITLYSYRRTFVTRLAQAGLDIKTLKKATGHKSTSSLERYIEANDEAISRAMLTL
jgi:integrase/recombinase XerD